MGMFDEVWLPCPQCGEKTYAQSKSGWCQLDAFEFDDAPARVLGDIVDEVQTCSKCGTQFSVKAKFFIEAIP